MKKLLILALLCSACGSEKEISKIEPTPPPTVIEEKGGCDSSLVGNWISATNTLSFKSNCTAKSGDQDLNWKLDSENNINFSSGKLTIDVCAYEIIPHGGLNAPLSILLEMICQKSGALHYTKQQ